MKLGLTLILLVYSELGFGMKVLVTYFDPFEGRPKNNSEYVAKALEEMFPSENVELHTCTLRTVFDKAFFEIQDCISQMERPPAFVISLGEASCSGVKIETRGLNYDRSYSPDNDGMSRNGDEIYPGEAKSLGVKLPVDEAYCKLSDEQQKGVFISNNAGSFVCNNTLYHSLRNLEIPSTFIHVSRGNCRNSISRVDSMAQIIKDIINGLAESKITDVELPSNRNAVRAMLRQDLSPCMRKFYGILANEY